MSEGPLDVAPGVLAPWVRDTAKRLSERIGSPAAAKTTHADALDYYRGVIVGDGPETPDTLRARIGESQYAEVLHALNLGARRRAGG